METPVNLPTRVVKIESGESSVVSLPENCVRMVFCYPERECYPCMVSHVFQLCNLFDSTEYTTIILFCPPKHRYESTIESIKAADYDFPIYFLLEDESAETKKALSSLRYDCFLLGEDNMPLSIGDPVRDNDAYERFRSALDSLQGTNND